MQTNHTGLWIEVEFIIKRIEQGAFHAAHANRKHSPCRSNRMRNKTEELNAGETRSRCHYYGTSYLVTIIRKRRLLTPRRTSHVALSSECICLLSRCEKCIRMREMMVRGSFCVCLYRSRCARWHCHLFVERVRYVCLKLCHAEKPFVS